MTDAGANRRGILALCMAMACFAVNDALLKITILHNPVGEMIFLRSVITLAFLGCALIATRQVGSFALARQPVIMSRGILDALASATFVIALAHMPLANLVAVNLTSPLLMTVMAVLFYREDVRWRRWAAISVGLIGVLFVVKPAPGSFDKFAMLGLLAAFFSASRDLITRQLDPRIPALTVSFIGTICVALSGLAIGVSESWQAVSPSDLGFVTGSAFFLAVGMFFLVHGFRGVEISIVAPFRYTLLIWGALAGYATFGEIPDRWSMFGAALIVGSGLYTLHRETVRRRPLSTPPAP